ncbi:MAG: hypothetical protein HUU06_07980 [Planctomycetaceae bacterium]|nr:hypothetical protein [Planctomycetota bacterium]NUN52707.1 hypothetical protein [Planctomycetaceae bacterium]
MPRIAFVALMGLALAACAAPEGGPPAKEGPAAPRAGGVKPYPLSTCLVTGSRLGSMGDPVVKVYDGQEIRFCCDACVEEFEADPAKFLAMLPK